MPGAVAFWLAEVFLDLTVAGLSGQAGGEAPQLGYSGSSP